VVDYSLLLDCKLQKFTDVQGLELKNKW